MEQTQPTCMVRNSREVRPMRIWGPDWVTEFLLRSERYGDVICMVPTIEKTACQLGRELDV
ncbi:MAG: hypothetical protein MKZ85_04300 [Pedosphaera sp.]|nr:hypothetical protein [Pedosphaera sp.]